MPITGPYDGLIAASGLNVGDTGYLQLDADGIGTGLAATPPPVGNNVQAIRVIIREPSEKFPQVMSPSGSELIGALIPTPDFRLVPH